MIEQIIEKFEKEFTTRGMFKEINFNDKLFPLGEFYRDAGIIIAVENFIRSEFSSYNKESLEEWKQFILNVLDGIDIADEQVGVVGGTKAIRLAIQSRI